MSGGREVIASGTIVPFRGESVTIEVTEKAKISIHLRFGDTKEDEKPTVDAKAIDDTTLDLVLINYAQVLGAGFLEPIEFGMIDGTRVFLALRAYALKGGAPTVHFTLYRGGV